MRLNVELSIQVWLHIIILTTATVVAYSKKNKKTFPMFTEQCLLYIKIQHHKGGLW